MGQPLNNSSYFCNLLKISNKDSKNNSCVPKFVLILLIPLLEALLYIAVKIHCYNFKTGVRISLSPFFLFLLLVPMSSRCQKPCCPSDYPPTHTLFCPPPDVNHQNIAQRCSEGRDVQLGLYHHLLVSDT